MDQLFNFTLVAFTSFITVMNPLGVIPVFLAMTSSLEQKDRVKTAIKACTVAFFTLVGFALTGELVFNFFGISVHSLRVVGGIIFFMMGQDMLQARLGRMKEPPKEVKKYVGDISITPLAIPMITGPGAITNAIVLMQDSSTYPQKTLLILVMAVVCFIVLTALVYGSKILNFFGETGTNVMMRLMGLIVMVIAVEFFFSGVTPLVQKMITTLQ